ncbi:MAG: ribonuclease J, partial [Armatimonadia bacterium]|nr:ribonuclease J [Armatimonadia bacterium]
QRIQADEMDDYAPEEITIVTTGSQGEPTSALTRMSVGEHRKINIREGDTVVLSATPIPGNEALIWRTVNNLFLQGANVIYPPHELVHVSGHGHSEEIKLMFSLTKPEHVVPYHGEARHQHAFRDLATEAGIAADKVHLMQPYDVLEITESGASIVERIPGEPLLVDGEGVGDVGAAVLRERRVLSEDGVVFVTAVLDGENREIIDGPAIETRGFIYIDESEELMDAALDAVAHAVADADPDLDTYDLEREVKGALTRLFRRSTGRRPQIIPVLFEVETVEERQGVPEEAS